MFVDNNTGEVASVFSQPFVSSVCFTAGCLAHRQIIIAVLYHFYLPKITAAYSDGYGYH